MMPACAYCAEAVFRPSNRPRGAVVYITVCAKCGASTVVAEGDPTIPTTLVRSGVYFVRCGDFVKIGISDDVPERFVTLQAQNPLDLEPLGVLPCDPSSPEGRGLERSLHAKYADIHHRFEWFRATPQLLLWISTSTLKPEPFFKRAIKKIRSLGDLAKG